MAVYVGTALLLVQSSYRREWHLSGGGVSQGEFLSLARARGRCFGASRTPELHGE